ncbi:hypothetical protein LXL04_028644 [Taraxacum kok-saghyz]
MVVCFCVRNALMRTSWTDLNPGRRFWGCPKPFTVPDSYIFSFFFCSYSKRSTCGFIGWIDGPMCERSKHVIPCLLRSMNRVERALEKSKEEVQKLKIYMFCSWVWGTRAMRWQQEKTEHFRSLKLEQSRLLKHNSSLYGINAGEIDLKLAVKVVYHDSLVCITTTTKPNG